MLASFHHSLRLMRIMLVLLIEGAWPWRRMDRRMGKNLARALPRLGPAFIKLGQVLSTRSDLIGEDVAEELSSLRDRLLPFPALQARAIIETELMAPISQLFAEFDDVPVAAASIAQVHRARTNTGREVAVKILRPGIEKAFARDLALFFWLADIIDGRNRRLKARQIVETLKASVFFELDLRFEAAAASELAENIKSHSPGFRVPLIFWELTSQRVLTAEWIDGIPIDDIDAIRKSGFDPDMILAKCARSLFSQVFIDGFFHADLHPGNLFVDKNGDVAAVDFGIMGRLDLKSRLYMAEILRGFLNGDWRRVAEVHFTAGYVPSDKSVDAFAQACMAVARPITGKPASDISAARLLGQMFRIAAEFEMETQPQLLLLQKTMMVTEGVGRKLSPNVNVWELARPMFEEWAGDYFGAAGKLKEATRQGADFVRTIPTLLGNAERMLRVLSDPAGLRLHPETVRAMDKSRARQRHWLIFAWMVLILGITLGLALIARG